MTRRGNQAVEKAATGSLEFKTGLRRQTPKQIKTKKIRLLRGKKVGKVQSVTLCLFVCQDCVCPLHLPLEQLRGAHGAGLLARGHRGHFRLGARRGAAGHAG